jgi:hypothetical protein
LVVDTAREQREIIVLHVEVKMQTALLATLSALDDDFDAITGFDVIPDGMYWAVVEDVSFDTIKRTGNPRMTWMLCILGPDRHGRQMRRDFVITRDSLKWLKRDLYLCGLELGSLSDLPGRCANLVNLKVLVRKQGRAVRILMVGTRIGEEGHMFLHLLDEKDHEYLDQQLQPRQQPLNQDDFEALVDHFVDRYQCPRPHRAYIEDAKTGDLLFTTDQP